MSKSIETTVVQGHSRFLMKCILTSLGKKRSMKNNIQKKGSGEVTKKNWKAYFYVYKVRIQKALAYRFDVYGNIIWQCIVMFSTAFFWKALYVGYDTVKGVQVEDMLTYTIVSSMMSLLFQINVESRVISSVRKGTVATDMLKPINLYGIYLFEDLGQTTAIFFQNVIPVFFIGSLFIAVPKPDSLQAFLLFLPSLVISYMINWLLAACYSTWAFTAIHMSPMVAVKQHLVRLLSGSIIPMWFFPEWLSNILNVLPFVYIYQLPLDIYIGKIGMEEILIRTGIQLVWLLLLGVLFLYLQKRVTKHVMVQGG